MRPKRAPRCLPLMSVTAPHHEATWKWIARHAHVAQPAASQGESQKMLLPIAAPPLMKQNQPIMLRLQRRLPVRRTTQSVTTPPAVLPMAPPARTMLAIHPESCFETPRASCRYVGYHEK